MMPTDTKRSSSPAPGPRSWPVIGNLGILRGVLPFLEQQWRRHGDVFRVQLAGQSATVLTHPEDFQRVLATDRANFIKGPAYDPMRKLLGDGLLTLEGETWNTRHALAQPAFHRRSIMRLSAVMAKCGTRFCDQLASELGGSAQIKDVHRMFVHLTLDVAICALFGEGGLDSQQISYESLSQAMEIMSDGVNGFRLPDWIPTPKNRKFKRIGRELDRGVLAIVEHARQNYDPEAGSLLSMLLGARDESGTALSNEEVRAEVFTLFIAGHETTALTLTWVFALLDQHADVMVRMRDEVDSVLAGREPTFEDVAKLPYVRQVVDETLRLRPVGPFVARNVVNDDQIRGFSVGRGEMVMPFIWGLHRHPAFWSHPERFDPERFAAGEAKARHKWSYMPFSGGARVCIGSTFALVESVILLAQLLTRFDLQVQSCKDVKPTAIGTVRPSSPVRVRFKVRHPR